jgi:hypothetical protein
MPATRQAEFPAPAAYGRCHDGLGPAPGGPEASNALFTPDEQAEISRRLDEINTLVRQQFEVTEEQFAAMDYKLDEAKEAAKIDLTTTDATSIIAPTTKPPAPMPCQIT